MASELVKSLLHKELENRKAARATRANQVDSLAAQLQKAQADLAAFDATIDEINQAVGTLEKPPK